MTKPHVVRVTWDVIVQADNKKEAEEIVKGKIPAMMKNTGLTSGFRVEDVNELTTL
jgi:hypothetical protein